MTDEKSLLRKIVKCCERLRGILIFVIFLNLCNFSNFDNCLYSYIGKDMEEKASVLSKKDKVNFYISKGDEYLLCDEYDHAIDSYKKAKSVKEKNPKVLLRLGEAYRLANMKDEAINFYKEALKYGSRDVNVFLGLGSVYKLKFLYEQSEEFYKNALKIENNNILALKGLSGIYEEQGKYTEAIGVYETIFALIKTDELKLKLAVVNLLNGRNEEISKYGSALSDFKMVTGYVNMRRDSETAISDFISADEYFFRAVVYLQRNEISKAKKSLEILIGQNNDPLSKKLAIALLRIVNMD